MIIKYITEVTNFDIAENEISTCYAKANFNLKLRLSRAMSTKANYFVAENREFNFSVIKGFHKNETYDWLSGDDESYVVLIQLETELWHLISLNEFEENFHSKKEMRTQKINNILDIV